MLVRGRRRFADRIATADTLVQQAQSRLTVASQAGLQRQMTSRIVGAIIQATDWLVDRTAVLRAFASRLIGDRRDVTPHRCIAVLESGGKRIWRETRKREREFGGKQGRFWWKMRESLAMNFRTTSGDERCFRKRLTILWHGCDPGK